MKTSRDALIIWLTILVIVLSPKAFCQLEKTIISGQLIKAADQTPVADAPIELFLHNQLLHEFPAQPVSEKPFKKTVSDPNGFFRFELILQDLPNPSELGPVLLVIRKEGLAVGLERINGEIFHIPQKEPVVITLNKPVVLKGTVVDSEGKPIAQAQVSVFQYDSLNNRNRYTNINLARIDAISTYTDSTGSFELNNVPPYRYVNMIAHKAGMGRTWQQTQNRGIDREQKPIKFTLNPAAHVKGVLVDKVTEKPIPFVSLRLEKQRSTMSYSSLTDLEGRFFFEDIEPDKYTLRFYDSTTVGYARSNKEVTTEAGKTTSITFELFEGGAVAFLAIDSEHKRPLPNVEIRCASSFSPNSMLITTSTNGRYRWRDLEPGEYFIEDVYKKGYRTNYCDIHEPFIIESGKTTSLEFYLSPSPHFRGIVLDLDQKPVPGTEVVLYTKRSFRTVSRHTTEPVVTDSEGRFDIAWDPVDKTPVPDYVFARCPEKNLAILQSTTTALDELCYVQMHQGVTVAGQVENAEGQPLADVRVIVSLWPIDEKGKTLLSWQESSDKDGIFEIPAIPRNCSIRGCVIDEYGFRSTGLPFEKEAPLQEEFIVLDPFVVGKNR